MKTGDADEPSSARSATNLHNPEYVAAFLEISTDAVVLFDSQECITHWNPAAEQMFGWTAQEALGKTPAKLFWPLNSPEEKKNRRQRQSKLKRGETLRGEYHPCRKDNSILRVHYTTRAVFDAEGKVTGYLAIYRDVSTNVQTPMDRDQPGAGSLPADAGSESTSSEDVRKFTPLFDKAGFAAALSEPPAGTVVDVNTAWLDMFGYTREEVIGKTSLELNLNPDVEGRARLIEQIQENGFARNVELILQRKSGEWGNFLANMDLVEVDGRKYFLNTAQDITEHKQEEEFLRARTEEVEALLEVSPVAIFVAHDPECVSITANPAGYRLVELTEDSGVNISKSAPVHERPTYRVFRNGEEVPAPDLPMQKAARLGVDVYEDALELRFDNGSQKFIYAFAKPLFDARGESRGAIAAMLDITERKRVEEELQASQQVLETVVKHMPAAVAVIRGSDLRVQLINPAYQAIAPDREMVGHTLDELWQETGQDFTALCRHVLETGEPYQVVDELNMVRRQPEGPLEPAYFTWSLYRVRLPGKGGWGLLHTSRETTARKQGQRTLARQKELLQSIFENIPVLLVLWDPHLQQFTLNSHAETVLGWTNADANSGSFMSMVYPDPAYRAEVSAYMQSLAGGFRELLTTARNGEQIPIEWANIGLADNTMIGIGVDLRERKRAKEALHESESQYRRLYESMRDGFVIMDMAGRIKEFNEPYRQMLGYENNELEGLSCFDTTPEQWHALERAIAEEQILPRGYSEVYEKAYRRKDGTTIPVELRTFLLKNEHGNNLGMWSIVRDISERKRAENALRESEERLRRIIETSPVAIGFGDATGRIIDANLSFYTLTGYSREELQASQLGWDKLTAPEYAEIDRQLLAMVAATGVAGPYEKEYIRKDGSRVRLLVSLSKLSEGDEHIAFLIDITERKRTQEALAQVLNELYQHINNSPLATILFDHKLRIMEWSAGAERMFGWRLEDVLNKTVGEFRWVHEKDMQRVANISADMLAGIQTRNTHACRNYRKDGSIIECEWYNSAMLDANGKLLSMRSQILNVTDRKRAEETLREVVTKYWLALNAGSLGTWDYDFGDEVFWDERSRAIHGVDPDEKIRLMQLDVVYPDDRAFVQKAIAQAIDPSTSGDYHVEYRVVWRDGSIHWVSSSGQAYFAGEGRERHPVRFIGTVRDITRRKEREAELKESQKQLQLLNESLEQKVLEKTAEVRFLAADLVKVVQRERHRLSHILHDDLQQRIYAIRTQMIFLRDVLESENEAAHREVVEVERQLDEVRKITRNLSIDLSPPILRDEGLAHAINWLAAQMRQQYGLSIEVRANESFAIPDEELHILLFNCVREVLFNTVKHAEASHAVVALQWTGDGIQIDVSDNGKGFIVRPLELPTGLGLPTIRHQLGLFGGSIAVQSEPGAGTQITMIVPVAQKK